ncbi:DUF1499 domain-containing protein [Qipengyuania aquimaris]|uniref:DUF1499 domain-containing protein n=1 Tax=Qipengyuania aquimaris TaxID=255984 RepID=UPI001C988F24|nr:DUF1499 domain-containing protein [Qipengyuania aquimaris]MBY6128035.1 DUF1499 domain-containing protein [Qipengyuania aquimaris]
MTDTNEPQDNPAETPVEAPAATPAPAETPAKAPLVWRKALPKWSLWVSLAVLAWFAFAVFGPKIGIIGWQTGLIFMIRDAGLLLIGVSALFALIALLFAFFKTPRGPWWKAAIALAIPVILFLGLLTMRAQAESVPPIHDVATDLRNPPTFSAQTMAVRAEAEANPINDYGTPLGQLPMWANSQDEALKAKNHADIIAEEYEDLQPIIVGGASDEEAMDAIVAAMGEIGLQNVRRVEGTNNVEGVAETFAFGFKDDVVARLEDGQIDLRSVSRVGVSDLGYNASRLEDLREAIIERLEN